MKAMWTRHKAGERRTWRCPDEASLAAYADGQLAGRDKAHVEAHVSDCDFCLGQVACLLRLQDAETLVEVPETLVARARRLAQGKRVAPARPAWRWGAVVAATGCLAVVTVVWLRQPGAVNIPSPPAAPRVAVPPADVSPPQLPATAAPQVKHRSVRKAVPGSAMPELLFPREGSVVAAEGIEFRWNEVPRSIYYEVRLLTAEGDLVWEGRTEQTQVRIREDLRLAAGQKYYVSVRACLPEGKTVKLPTVGFQAADED